MCFVFWLLRVFAGDVVSVSQCVNKFLQTGDLRPPRVWGRVDRSKTQRGSAHKKKSKRASYARVIVCFIQAFFDGLFFFFPHLFGCVLDKLETYKLALHRPLYRQPTDSNKGQLMSMSWSPVLSGLSQGGFPNLRQEGQESEEERHRNISQYVSAAASEIESRREDLSQQRDERDEQEDRKHKDFGGGSDEEMMHGGVGLNEEEFVFDAETVGLRDIARVLSCLQVARGGGGSGGGKAPKARQQVLAVLRLAKEGIKFYIKGDRDYAAHTTLNAGSFARSFVLFPRFERAPMLFGDFAKLCPDTLFLLRLGFYFVIFCVLFGCETLHAKRLVRAL